MEPAPDRDEKPPQGDVVRHAGEPDGAEEDRLELPKLVEAVFRHHPAGLRVALAAPVEYRPLEPWPRPDHAEGRLGREVDELAHRAVVVHRAFDLLDVGVAQGPAADLAAPAVGLALGHHFLLCGQLWPTARPLAYAKRTASQTGRRPGRGDLLNELRAAYHTP